MLSAYKQFVDVVRASCSEYGSSVFLVGSVLWDEATVLHDGTPVSDIDLVVVGDCLDELRRAARGLTALFVPLRRSDAPFFKLGMKLRMPSELTGELLCANTFAAVTCGRLLSGSRVPFALPGLQWYRRQADLVVPTRLQCNSTQREQLGAKDVVLHRYLAARTLLDITAVAATGLQDVVGSRVQRLARFERKLQRDSAFAPSEREMLRHSLAAAARTKKDPERHSCGTLADAERLLSEVAIRCGAKADAADRQIFWQAERPLDVRDWEMRHAP